MSVPVTPERMFSMQKRLNEMWNKTHIIQCQECVFSPTPWSSSKVHACYTPSDAPIFGIFRISLLFLRQLSGALLSSDHSLWQYLSPFTRKTLCLNADFRPLILRLMAFFKQCIHCQCKVLKGRKSLKLKKGRNLQKTHTSCTFIT